MKQLPHRRLHLETCQAQPRSMHVDTCTRSRLPLGEASRWRILDEKGSARHEVREKGQRPTNVRRSNSVALIQAAPRGALILIQHSHGTRTKFHSPLQAIACTFDV